MWPTTAGAYGALLAKMSDIGTAQGWALTNNSFELQVFLRTRNASVASTAGAVTVTAGLLNVLVAERSGTTHSMQIGTGTPSTATATSLDTSNVTPLRIGANITGGQVWQGELLAAAVFRRALSATEIAAINTYYGTA
jgi:hypothetical protein